MSVIENLDGFLKLKLDQLYDYKSEKTVLYQSFYNPIPNEKLREIFSILHCSINNLFSYMNDKNEPGRGGHYNAHESRMLILFVTRKLLN